MAKINRFTGDFKAFGSAAVGTERTIFGASTQSDIIDDNIVANFLRGWGIVGVNQNPTKQDFNALGFTLSQVLAYLHQQGVAGWDSLQEYNADAITTKSGIIYISQVDANIGNDPVTDTGANWVNTNIPLPSIVTQTDAEAGISTIARLWTAQRVNQAIAALERAQSTTAQAQAGVNTTTDMSPARVKEAISSLSNDFSMGIVPKLINTIYTTTSKPRAIATSVSLTGFNGSCNLEVNFAGAGFVVVQSWGINGSVGSRGNLSYVIPPNTQYRISGSTNIVVWSESL
ncbi:MAG: hypothetical protein JKY80_01975 [Mariprofundaceae bacterium]|nr:hypothetical protein [Methylophaga sp.]MBL4759608.1 hypothetical protein [Mariprofundaceae bacterium]